MLLKKPTDLSQNEKDEGANRRYGPEFLIY